MIKVRFNSKKPLKDEEAAKRRLSIQLQRVMPNCFCPLFPRSEAVNK